MDEFVFLMQNFFTHKDFLPAADQIPGTLFSPLHFVYETVVLAIVIGSAFYVARHKKIMKATFTWMLAILVIFEVVIISWDTLAGSRSHLDLAVNLSLYPCSIFMYVMPFVIWGKGLLKRMACGYVCSLGLLGALINFLYPVARLMDYSCISFAALHTFTYHGCMLFTCLVLLISGEHSYTRVTKWWEPFLASVPGLVLSIPANLVNYSSIQADYMYFTNQHFLSQRVFGTTPPHIVTMVMYGVYLVVPALFYLPSLVAYWVTPRWVPTSAEHHVSYLPQKIKVGMRK